MLKMNNSETFGLVVAGVGGQGAITTAQLVLGAAWMSGLHVLQSEVHGMSQRGGEVSAHILFSKDEVTSPTIEMGTGNLLLGLEPLETLRHLIYIKKDGHIISSSSPIINMGLYPRMENVMKILKSLKGMHLIDSEELSLELGFIKGSNIILLGATSRYLPIEDDIWEQAISERFRTKGDEIIEKNLNAFRKGQSLIKQ